MKLKRYTSCYSEDAPVIDQTQTPEFKKWFGNSKVVKNGKPLVVYHGTNKEFNVFDLKYFGQSDDGFFGKAFYFGDIASAKKYGNKIMPVFLHIEKPLYLTDDDNYMTNKWIKMRFDNVEEFEKKIRTSYDGVIYSGNNISDGKYAVQYAVFDPNQIKSATNNNGNFSRSSNNIYEDITIPLEKGDTFRAGKFKNKSYVYDSHYINDKGDVIIRTASGKEVPLLKVRLVSESKKVFSENIRFSDLMNMASLSDFTRDYNKETNKLMGNPTNHTKLRGMKINKEEGYVTFVWKTKRTPKYKKGTPMKAVDPLTLELKPARLYTIEIRILKFFEWLNTAPDKITNKDIEDVLKVADIQIWDSTPMWQFQGGNYNLSLFNGSIRPETRSPEVWNNLVSKYGKTHNENQFLSKHSAGVVNSIKFYIPQMRQMIKSYLKSK